MQQQYDPTFQNKMLTKMEYLVGLPNFKNMYKVDLKRIIGWAFFFNSQFDQYDQEVMFGISWDEDPEELIMHWWHEMPYPYKDWTNGAGLILIGQMGATNKGLKSDDLYITTPENIEKAKSLNQKLKSLYGSVPRSGEVFPQLTTDLKELSKNHHKKPKAWYGLEMLDTLIKHTK